MDQETRARIKAISMLSKDVLAKLAEYAGRASAGILEIGPYIGGSTVALAMGNRGVPHIAIEMGGAYLEHPTLPSRDILADLEANLLRFGVRQKVTIVPGPCYEPEVRGEAFSQAPAVDLLFIDADGKIDAIMAGVVDHLTPDCALIFDDFETDAAPSKQADVQRIITKWLEVGAINDTEIVDGTWFGRVANLEILKSAREPSHDDGHAFVIYGVEGAVVLEDGKPLGPRCALHAEIRALGAGRFSFDPAHDPYRRQRVPSLYFSSSDNSDPRTNGRRYEVR